MSHIINSKYHNEVKIASTVKRKQLFIIYYIIYKARNISIFKVLIILNKRVSVIQCLVINFYSRLSFLIYHQF